MLSYPFHRMESAHSVSDEVKINNEYWIKWSGFVLEPQKLSTYLKPNTSHQTENILKPIPRQF